MDQNQLNVNESKIQPITTESTVIPVVQPQKTPKHFLIIIIIFILLLLVGGIGLISGVIKFGSTTQPDLTVVPSPISSPDQIGVEPSPVEETTECINKAIGISIKIPKTWTCDSREISQVDGSMNITSDLFNIDISNMGRGPACGGAGPESEIGCKVTPYFSNEKVELSLFNYQGEDKEIFGGVKIKSQGNLNQPWISVTYKDMGVRQLTENEKADLIQILNSISDYSRDSWSLYNSADGGFSFKYPANWTYTLCNDFSNDRFPEAVLNIDPGGKKIPCGSGGGVTFQIKFESEANVRAQIDYAPKAYKYNLTNLTIGKNQVQAQKLEVFDVLPNTNPGPVNLPSVTFFIPHQSKRNSTSNPYLASNSYLVFTYLSQSINEMIMQEVLNSLELY